MTKWRPLLFRERVNRWTVAQNWGCYLLASGAGPRPVHMLARVSLKVQHGAHNKNDDKEILSILSLDFLLECSTSRVGGKFVP